MAKKFIARHGLRSQNIDLVSPDKSKISNINIDNTGNITSTGKWTFTETVELPESSNVVKKTSIVNDFSSTDTEKPLSAAKGKELKELVDNKQNTLESTVNIKSINNTSILGAGNLLTSDIVDETALNHNNIQNSGSTSHDEIDELLSYYINESSAGRLWGGQITANDEINGTVNISAGEGLVKTAANGSACDLGCSPSSTAAEGLNLGNGSNRVNVSWSTITNFPLVGIGYNIIYWSAANEEFRAVLKENFYSQFNLTNDFTIGRIYWDGTSIVSRLCGMNNINTHRRVQLFGEERFPVERAFGLNISTSNRHIKITSGVLWAELVNRFTVFPDGDFDSSEQNHTFTYWYKDPTNSLGWNKQTEQSLLNNQQYDDGSGTLQTLTSNRYTVQWVYVVHNSTVHIVYGTGNSNFAQAEVDVVPANIPGLLASYATLVGKIIIQKDATTVASVQSPFVTTFQTSTVASHNDLSSLQGGSLYGRYHLTQTQHSKIANFDPITKQNVLESGTNIKTINGDSVLGSGDLESYALAVVSDSEPTTVKQGLLWVDTTDINNVLLKVRVGTNWIQLN